MSENEQKHIFDNWLSEHKGIFFKIVRSYAFTPHDQDDLFQEIALQVWRSIPDFRHQSKPSTWIYRVALFTATTWKRREKKQPETQSLTETVLTMTDQPRDERLEWLYEQIAKLDEIDRSICLLMLEGYGYREIAELIGISTSSVGVKIHRIKQRLVRQSKEIDHHGV